VTRCRRSVDELLAVVEHIERSMRPLPCEVPKPRAQRQQRTLFIAGSELSSE
jgi:hypothetical protein